MREVLEVEIEILPSGTRFEAGEGLLLIVQGTDIKRYPMPLVYARHEDTVNAGPHRIHTGPGHPSRIVLPVLPALLECRVPGKTASKGSRQDSMVGRTGWRMVAPPSTVSSVPVTQLDSSAARYVDFVRPVNATDAPSLANISTMPAPIPAAPPVPLSVSVAQLTSKERGRLRN
jgi:hypothetical protein